MSVRHLVSVAVLVLVFSKIGHSQDEPAGPVAEAEPAAEARVDGAKPEDAARPITASVNLHGGVTIFGTVINLTEVTMQTSFGQTNLPLTQVAGIKFASDGIPSTTVVLHNGDSITGSLDVDQVTLQTEWGKAEINGPNVADLMLTQGVVWKSQTSVAGTRWTLAESVPEATADEGEEKPAAKAEPRTVPTRTTRPGVFRFQGF